MSNWVLSLHAFPGCDTTSHLYGIVKCTYPSSHLRTSQTCNVKESATPEEISVAEQTLDILYNLTPGESLKFCATNISTKICHKRIFYPSIQNAKFIFKYLSEEVAVAK